MRLRFTKMQGLGNDFVVIDALTQHVALSPEQVRRLADRRFGVGCDQLLLVEAPHTPDMDFRYRIFNADGQEVEQCGNGARCFARFVRERGLSDARALHVETAGGPLVLRIQEDEQITVDMGAPRLEPGKIPFLSQRPGPAHPLTVGGERLEIGVVSMGNPHAVLVVEDVHMAPVARLGPQIESHEHFPQRVNVGFMQIIDATHIRLRVHERGVGETLACGTGACAAVVVGRLRGMLDKRVQVDLPGGRLVISWVGGEDHVMMTGPASSVFDGTIEL
jgi:diaminopimelate epimerase